MLWSEAVYEILGLDPAITDPTIERALELVVPEQRGEVRRLATIAFEREATIDTDVRIRRPDGEVRELHVVARAQLDEAGVPDHWWGTITDTTELPGHLHEAIQSEGAYRTVLGDLLAVVYRTKGDPVTGEIEFLGPYTHEVLGHRPEAFQQDPGLWRRAVHPDDRGAFASARRRVMQEGEPTSQRYRFEIGTSAGWIWLEDHLFPIRGEDGEVVGVTGIARDITEEHESRTEYEALVNALPDFVLVADRDGTIRQVVETAHDRAYLAEEEVVGQRIEDVASEGSAERFREAIEQALDLGELVTLRYDLETDEGTVRFEGRVTPVNGDRILWVARDVSERTKAPEAVGRQEKDLRLAEEIAGLGYWSWWPEADEVEWSPGLYHLYGYDPGEVEASYERFLDLVPPEHRSRVDASIREALDGRERWVAEYPIRMPDGAERMIRSIGLFETDETGAVRMFGTSLDVTDLRGEQRKLARRARELQAANVELERFAHATAHELKEPVRNVVSFAQMLDRHQAEQLDEEGRELLEKVVGGVSRMADRIDNLMTYTEEGELPRSAERVELDWVAEETLQGLEDRLESAQADVTVDELGTVEVDRRDAVELFEQLLDNAVSFRREDVPLEIEISARGEDGMRVVSIADNGRGIPAGHRDEVFELFEPLHTMSQGGGAGVGLAICHRIVERYGGQLQVASTEGEGAVFSFSLPAADA